MCQDEPQRRCPLVILALGKLGGQEPNYHSDLDVVFLYEEDGATAASNPSRVTTNQHFFSQLSSKVVARMGHVGPAGRLYEVDARLRPTGRSGMLVVSIAEFCRYFSEGDGQLWERLALCKARPVFGDANVIARVMDAVSRSIFCRPWRLADASEMAEMRFRLEESASAENLKRGVGGTMDVEFGVQLLQLRWGEKHPSIMVPGTLPAIQALKSAGVLSAVSASSLGEDYSYLRSIESRLRLLNTTARHDLPQEPKQLKKLAYIVRSESDRELLERVGECRKRNRGWFLQTVKALSQESS